MKTIKFYTAEELAIIQKEMAKDSNSSRVARKLAIKLGREERPLMQKINKLRFGLGLKRQTIVKNGGLDMPENVTIIYEGVKRVTIFPDKTIQIILN